MYDFLAGSNSKFDAVPGRILGQRPILTLMEVCSKVLLEEDRFSAMNIITTFVTDSTAFSAKSSGTTGDKQNGKLPQYVNTARNPGIRRISAGSYMAGPQMADDDLRMTSLTLAGLW